LESGLWLRTNDDANCWRIDSCREKERESMSKNARVFLATFLPTGVAAFPKENSQVPRRFCEQYFDLQRYTRMPAGGHFAPVEQPEALAAELRAFLR